MFKIAPIQSFSEQVKAAEQCGSVAHEGYFAYSMTDIDSGLLMGFSQFEIKDGVGYVSDLRPTPGYSDDFEAMFILGRQTLNFIDLCGIHIATASRDSGDERLLRAIGFKPNESTFFCDMTGFFDGHCDGSTVNL